MTDLDRLLRTADPAARLTAPAPGAPPLDRPRPARPPRRPTHWLPAVAAAIAVLLVVGVVATGLGRDRSAGPAGTTITSAPAPATSPPVSPSPPPPHVTAPVVATAAADKARAQRVLADLRDAVPAPFAAPGQVRSGPRGALEIAYEVRAFSLPADPVTTVQYQVYQDVTAGDGIGQIWALVVPATPAFSDDPCVQFQRMDQGLYDTCAVTVTPTGARVAVGGWALPGREVTSERFASSRSADGTFVFLMESRGIDPALPALPTRPLTDAQLIAAVTDPAFGR
jgi:hypothetical protein